MSLESGRTLRKRRRRKWKVLLFFELLILVLLILLAYVFVKLDSIPRRALNRDALEQVQREGDFTNIALFGTDAADEVDGMRVEREGDGRSDSIMIASINHQTGEVKVTSVFRDTLMQQPDGTYSKANAAYAFGGPQQAVAMLNRNLDLDIELYITVNFQSLAAIVNVLGGVEIDIQADEIEQTNLYTGVEHGYIITEPGPQMLSGVQAVGYSRVRYTEGGDFRRAQRQRMVLQQIVSRTRTAGPVKWLRLVDEALPYVETNLSTPEMLIVGVNLLRIQMDEMEGWPFDVTTSQTVAGLVGDYVVPIGHADNVRQLHGFLFGDEHYQVSERVQQISADIAWMTGIYP